MPHTLDTTEIAAFINDGWQDAASASTVDRTQRKRLQFRACTTSPALYRVTRRYFSDNPSEWETVYEGQNLNEAVRLYNGMG